MLWRICTSPLYQVIQPLLMTVSNTVFTVFSGIGLTLSVIPLLWHLGSRNVGTCMYAVWTALACLVYFVNSIIWDGNTVNRAPVWCDISIHIQIGASVALPACGLCIIRSLYRATVATVRTEERRETLTDLLITVGIPVLAMVAQYVVSSHRFLIAEDIGCAACLIITPLAFVLVYSWPLIIAIVSACYGALTLRAFMKRRKVLEDLIATNASLTYSRYWRLMFMASTDFIFTIPLATWAIMSNTIGGGSRPWTSWADVHSEYSQIPEYPWDLLDPNYIRRIEVPRWCSILCAFAFFGFFGLSNEAKKNYRLLASAITKYLGIAAFAEGMATPDPHVQSPLSFTSPPASFPSTTQSSALPDSSSAFPPIENVMQVLDAAPDPTTVRRASTPVAPIPVRVDNSEKI